MTVNDTGLMTRAIAEAEAAAARGEVPVGAVIYNDSSGEIIAAEGNRSIEYNDPTGHAEILAIRAAGSALGNYRLTGHSIIVTLEPCAMCAAAISFARLGRLTFGAGDPKGGAVIHGTRFFDQPTCHHRPQVAGGLMAEPSAQLLRKFFRDRR